MADEKELNDLRERITLLRWDDQLYLFELMLGDYRRKCEEARVQLRAMQEEFLANEELQRAVAAPFVFPPEAEREAG